MSVVFCTKHLLAMYRYFAENLLVAMPTTLPWQQTTSILTSWGHGMKTCCKYSLEYYSVFVQTIFPLKWTEIFIQHCYHSNQEGFYLNDKYFTLHFI